MSYKLTYTGQQVQDYLTKVATGQVGGTDDYNTLENRPVINADLDNTAANTADQTVLYHHIGESTATYKKAALYYTDGINWLQFKGEKGADGDTGLIALEYGETHTENYEGDIADEPIYLPLSGFNRTPVVDDKFLLVFNVTESGKTYIAPFTVLRVDATEAYASLSGNTNPLEITGPTGATGATGQQGSNGTNGKDGVSIIGATSGTPTVANGKTITPITLNFSDGSTKQINVQAKNGTDGAQGSKGDTGLTALEYGDIHTEQYEGDIADEYISLPISGFNRTPVVDDKFLLVFNVTESGSTYVATFTITEVSTTTAKAIVNVETIVKISCEGLPKVTAEDVGKFLRVNSNGNWVAEAVPSAEGASV